MINHQLLVFIFYINIIEAETPTFMHNVQDSVVYEDEDFEASLRLVNQELNNVITKRWVGIIHNYKKLFLIMLFILKKLK